MGIAAATGPGGRVHLVYEETQQNYSEELGTMARFLVQDGASWTSQRFRVGTHSFGGVSLHQVGNAEMVALYNDTWDNVQRALRFRAGRWEDPVPGANRLTFLSVEDGRGRIHSFSGGVEFTLLHSFSEDGTTWSAPLQVFPPGIRLHGSRVAVVDSRDRVHLIHVGRVDLPAFDHARFDNGSWSVIDGRPEGPDFDGTTAAIDAEDRIHLVWRSGRFENPRLNHAVLDVSR